MIKIYTIATLVFFLVPLALPAQTVEMNNGIPTNLSAAKMVRYVDEVDFNGLGGKTKVSYSRIKGSPFWSDEWKEADLFTESGKVGRAPVKLNFATDEIYFLKSGGEWVLQDKDIVRVVLINDSIEFQRNVTNLFLNKKKVDDLVAILNNGTFQLIRYVHRTIGSADSLFGTQKRYFFRDDIYYFIRNKEMIQPIRRLNREAFLSVLPNATQYNGWMDERKLTFKTEEDLLRFLQFYNSKLANAPE